MNPIIINFSINCLGLERVKTQISLKSMNKMNRMTPFLFQNNGYFVAALLFVASLLLVVATEHVVVVVSVKSGKIDGDGQTSTNLAKTLTLNRIPTDRRPRGDLANRRLYDAISPI